MTTEDISFRDLGFLLAFPGREFRTRENSEELGRGQVLLQVVSIRMLSDDVIEPASQRGLSLSAEFDSTQPDFVLLEAVGPKAAIAKLVDELKAAGYRDLDSARLLLLQQKPYELSRGGEGLEALPDFMTEKEIAKYLGKSLGAVKRFTDDGGLPFIPGRPRLIAKSDLLNFLKSLKTVRPVSADWLRERRKYVPYGMGVADTDSKLIAEARAWAMKMKLKPKRAPRGKSAKTSPP